MDIQLTSITFNHDLIGNDTSALNIRRNQDFEVPLPEYDITTPHSLEPHRSCAAYAISSSTGQNVVIRVSLSEPCRKGRCYEIQATGGGVLGRLTPIAISFAESNQISIDIPLNNRSLEAIGRHDIVWKWQCRYRRGQWTDLVSTSHRIYVLLCIPGPPWSQVFADKHAPWTDLLDHTCAIASGEKTAHQAKAAITKAIHRNYEIRYDIGEGGAVRYGFQGTGGIFELTEWIKYVLEGIEPPDVLACENTSNAYPERLLVNCDDCAAALALMAKSVGISSDFYTHQPFGYINDLELIGYGKTNNPTPGCGEVERLVVEADDPGREPFSHHSYTMLNGGRVFDACIREWMSDTDRRKHVGAAMLRWLIESTVSRGRVKRSDMLDRAAGWLTNLKRGVYEELTIDDRTPHRNRYVWPAYDPTRQHLDFDVT